MTKPFGHRIACPYCRREHEAETAFNRWFRNHPQFDSMAVGLVRFDLDLLLHRYKADHDDGMGKRTLQFMMFVEIKTHGAVLSQSQRDTLSTLSQVLRNRRRNMHSARRGLHANQPVVTKVKSRVTGKPVAIRLLGGHLLRLSGSHPGDSTVIEWDGPAQLPGVYQADKRISESTLCKLLRFELDPDTLRPMDLRRRYRSVKTLIGFECGICNEQFPAEVVHCPLCNGHYQPGAECGCYLRDADGSGDEP